jgi:hypothetical protein
VADLLADLLQRAQLASADSDKAYCLEQAREIMLHRDPRLLAEGIDDVLNFAADKSAMVRRLVVQFGADVLSKHAQSNSSSRYVPAVISAFTFLAADSNDNVVRRLALEMARLYGRVAASIATMSSSQRAGSVGEVGSMDPRRVWSDLKQVESALVDIVASNRPEAVRSQCVQFIMSVLRYSLSAPSAASGAVPETSLSREAPNVASIPLHHAFLGRDQIEQEARALLLKCLLWAKRGGPHGSTPFSSTTMIALGTGLARLACERPQVAHSIVPAVVSVVSSIADAEYKSALSSLQAASAGVDASTARPPVESFLEAVAVLRKNQFMSPSSPEARSPEYTASLKALENVCEAKASSRSGAASAPAPKPPSTGGAALLKTLMSAKEETFSDEEEDEPMVPAAAAGQKRKADEMAGSSVAGVVDEEDEDIRIKAMAVAALDALNVTQAVQGSAAAVEEEPSFIAMTSTDTLLNEEISPLTNSTATSGLTVVSAAFDAGAEELSFRPSASSGGAPSSGDLDREVTQHMHNVLSNASVFDNASPEV